MSRNKAKAKALVKEAKAVTGEWYDSPWQIALRAVGVAAGSVLVLFLAALLIVPRVVDGQALTVLSGSMSPSLNPGDVIVVRGVAPKNVCQEIQIGEIVTYFEFPNDPTLITHRVVSKIAGHYPDGTNCRLITKGDNNNDSDEPVSPEQVRGQLLYGIPKVGWAQDWVARNSKMAGAGALGVCAVAYLLSGRSQPKSRVLYLGGTEASSAGGPALGGGEISGFAGLPLGAPNAPNLTSLDFSHQMRELDLREREVRLLEREAAIEFGYQAPQWLQIPDASCNFSDRGRVL